jgi:hypothetical protein
MAEEENLIRKILDKKPEVRNTTARNLKISKKQLINEVNMNDTK